jgi:hypothetical protein
MNESTHRIATNKSQQPQNEENQKYGPKHGGLLSEARIWSSKLMASHFLYGNHV